MLRKTDEMFQREFSRIQPLIDEWVDMGFIPPSFRDETLEDKLPNYKHNTTEYYEYGDEKSKEYTPVLVKKIMKTLDGEGEVLVFTTVKLEPPQDFGVLATKVTKTDSELEEYQVDFTYWEGDDEGEVTHNSSKSNLGKNDMLEYVGIDNNVFQSAKGGDFIKTEYTFNTRWPDADMKPSTLIPPKNVVNRYYFSKGLGLIFQPYNIAWPKWFMESIKRSLENAKV